MDYLSEKEMITDYARELKINVLQNELEDFITLATQENWGCRTLIARILEKEMEIRVEKRRKQRVRIAGFPQMKYLQELIREDLPKDAQMVIHELETLEFVKEGRNVEIRQQERHIYPPHWGSRRAWKDIRSFLHLYRIC